MRGAGRVAFAAIVLLIGGTLNIIYGIGALDNANLFVNDTRYILTNLNTLGWVLIILGAIQLTGRLSLMAGRSYGRVMGIIACSPRRARGTTATGKSRSRRRARAREPDGNHPDGGMCHRGRHRKIPVACPSPTPDRKARMRTAVRPRERTAASDTGGPRSADAFVGFRGFDRFAAELSYLPGDFGDEGTYAQEQSCGPAAGQGAWHGRRVAS